MDVQPSSQSSAVVTGSTPQPGESKPEAKPDAASMESPTTPAATAAPAVVTPSQTEPVQAVSPAAPTADPDTPPAAAAAASAGAPKPEFALDMAAVIARLQRIEQRDRAAMTGFYGERQGAPLWVKATGRTAQADSLIAEIRRAGDWGLDASAFDMPNVRGGRSDGSLDTLALEEAEISAAVLKYARHARGGRVEPTALTKFLDRRTQVYDSRSLLKQIATAADPAEYLRDLHPQHPQFKKLKQKYLEARANGPIATGSSEPEPATPQGGKAKAASAPAKAPEGSARRLLANMEQWRWMPNDLGAFHIWVNVPEYTVRVVANGKVVHSERIIIGKIDTQTPIFSDEMEQVIFHPFWGVPDSIKQNEVLPSLRGNGAVLAKHNLRIQSGGRDIDPRSVNWDQADIRKFHVYQPPGSDNVLGVVKFRFPNKHDVYMHDTPTKNLFNQTVRTYSHGCMRVRDPVKLAEVILAHDKSMASDRVRALTMKDAPENNQVNLTRKIPVHITYFTASVEEDGRLKTFADIYGHEERIALGIEGKMHLIKPVPEPKGPPEPVASLRESNTIFTGFNGITGPFSGTSSSKGGSRVRDRDWARRVFENNN